MVTFLKLAIFIAFIAFLGINYALSAKSSNHKQPEPTKIDRLICDGKVVAEGADIFKPRDSVQWLMYKGSDIYGNYLQKPGDYCFVVEVWK